MATWMVLSKPIYGLMLALINVKIIIESIIKRELSMNRKLFQLAWLFSILLVITAACTFSEAKINVEKLKQGVKSVETSVEGALTQVGGVHGIAQTGEALATQVAQSGVWKTAQVVITQQGSELLATIQAAATQGITFGSAPADIPVVDKQTIVNFIGSDRFITYNTSLDFLTVLDFYKREMPNLEWAPVLPEPTHTETRATLIYEKNDRTATITLGINPLDQKAIVTIIIQSK